MRTRTALVASALAVALIGLAGCSSSGSPTSAPLGDAPRPAGVQDPAGVIAAAAAAPDDVAAQTAAADVEILSEQIEPAITRLVDLVRRTSGDERDAARVHLLGLLDALDPEDPRVLAGRRSLASALF